MFTIEHGSHVVEHHRSIQTARCLFHQQAQACDQPVHLCCLVNKVGREIEQNQGCCPDRKPSCSQADNHFCSSQEPFACEDEINGILTTRPGRGSQTGRCLDAAVIAHSETSSESGVNNIQPGSSSRGDARSRKLLATLQLLSKRLQSVTRGKIVAVGLHAKSEVLTSQASFELWPCLFLYLKHTFDITTTLEPILELLIRLSARELGHH